MHEFTGIVRGLREGLVDRLPAGDRLLLVRFAGQQIWKLGPLTTDREPQHAAMEATLRHRGR